jgi:hypothetical protein
MSDLLDAYSIHVFWDYWDTQKLVDRLTEVRAIVDALPESGLRERLRGRAAVRTQAGDAAARLLVQLCHAHREELVEVRGRDRAEPDPVEQRQALVGGQVVDTSIEVDPGQLAAEERALPRGPRCPLRGPGRDVVAHGRGDASTVTNGGLECLIP